MLDRRVDRFARQFVEPGDLLRKAQAHLCHDPRLDRRRASAGDDQRFDVDAVRLQDLSQRGRFGVRADYADLDRLAAQRDDVRGGIGCAAGDQAALLELQYRDRRFAAEARRLADQVFVEDHVAEHDHALVGKSGDEVG